MAIEERDLPGGRWERKFTGQDISKARGALIETGNEGYRKAFHKNEGIGFERVSDPKGNETWLRKDQVEGALKEGYGRKSVTPTFLVPELPWKQKRVSPGRHRYKCIGGSIVEVS